MGGTEREREGRFEHERGHKEGLSSFQETRIPFKKIYMNPNLVLLNCNLQQEIRKWFESTSIRCEIDLLRRRFAHKIVFIALTAN